MNKLTKGVGFLVVAGVITVGSSCANHETCREQQNIMWEDGYIAGMVEGDANGYARGVEDYMPRDAYVIPGWPNNREPGTLPGLRINLNGGMVINMVSITEGVSPECIEQGNRTYKRVSDKELLSGVKH